MDKAPRKRWIDVLLFEGVNALDVTGPVQAFDTARFAGRRVYELRYVSIGGAAVRASCGLRLAADTSLDDCEPWHDLLVPGGIGVGALLTDASVLRAVRTRLPGTESARGGAPMERGERTECSRIISICSGALVLAAAGILDGRIATTHWSREAKTREFGRVKWDLDRLFTSDGRVFTSAGVTTGVDLALAIIRDDCGNEAALQVARELVVQLRRTGGQSQYAMHVAGQFTKESALGRLIEAIVCDPTRAWTLDELADEAGMNIRTLSRRFREHLGISPARFVERTRVDYARGLLEAGLPAKTVASAAGFGDLQRMRRAFQRRFGVGATQYAAAFGSSAVNWAAPSWHVAVK